MGWGWQWDLGRPATGTGGRNRRSTCGSSECCAGVGRCR